MSKRRSYAGKDIEVSFDMARCIHARNCFLKLPNVFDPRRRPWVSPDAAQAEDIAAVIRTCPSGALAYTRQDGGVEESATPINRVSVLENGPLACQGDFTISGEQVQRATLCRCGKSSNKPFCDYAHVEDGFTATGEPSGSPKDEEDLGSGAVSVSPIANGPLKIEGPTEITTGTGRHVATKSKAFLCRCGASKTKPFCDGTHKEIGFQAD